MLDKKFVRAEIKKAGLSYKVTITYSYYGLYNYDVIEIFDTVDSAKDWLLKVRCHGHIYFISAPPSAPQIQQYE